MPMLRFFKRFVRDDEITCGERHDTKGVEALWQLGLTTVRLKLDPTPLGPVIRSGDVAR